VVVEFPRHFCCTRCGEMFLTRDALQEHLDEGCVDDLEDEDDG
jgi:hypothetical protein